MSHAPNFDEPVEIHGYLSEMTKLDNLTDCRLMVIGYF